jgi:hypothetical protein
MPRCGGASGLTVGAHPAGWLGAPCAERFFEERFFVALLLRVAGFLAPIRNESLRLPAFSAATSQSGGRPRPLHVLPLSSRYLAGTGRPASELRRPRPLLIANACLRSDRDSPYFPISAAVARRPLVAPRSSFWACVSRARIRARIVAADSWRGISHLSKSRSTPFLHKTFSMSITGLPPPPKQTSSIKD